jgi:hypothetical protein
MAACNACNSCNAWPCVEIAMRRCGQCLDLLTSVMLPPVSLECHLLNWSATIVQQSRCERDCRLHFENPGAFLTLLDAARNSCYQMASATPVTDAATLSRER